MLRDNEMVVEGETINRDDEVEGTRERDETLELIRDEIDEIDFVMILVESTCGMPLDDEVDEKADEHRVDEDAVDETTLVDVVRLHIEVDDEVEDTLEALDVQVDEVDVNEYL